MEPADLPSIDDLPIPDDVRPGKGWTPQMVEMADHIGAKETLLISQHFGGREVYIASDPDKNILRDIIGSAKAAVLSWAYGQQRITVPLAKRALHRARRAPIIAAVRAHELTVRDAARILGMRPDNTSRLVHASDEMADVVPMRFGRRKVDPRQMDFFPEDPRE